MKMNRIRNRVPTSERKRPNGGMRMRPMRVKVMKPMKEASPTSAPVVESHLTFGQMENLMEQAFGLKDFPMMRPGEFVQTFDSDENAADVVTNEDLVLEPTPAVPGRDVTEPRILFNEFLDDTTPVPTVIPMNNVKTIDIQGNNDYDYDYPIYDSRPVVQVAAPTLAPTQLKNSEFTEMPIFTNFPKSNFPTSNSPASLLDELPQETNFPMMRPGEFIQTDLGEGDEGLQDYFNSNSENAFTAFSDMQNNAAFDIGRPESMDLFKDDIRLPQLTPTKSFTNLVNQVSEEVGIVEEDRPFRSPHPAHRYPLFSATPAPAARPKPFTAKSPVIEV